MELSKFVNHPPTDFTNTENISLMKGALAYVRSELGKMYPIAIGEKKYDAKDMILSRNPFEQDRIVGKIFKAEKKHAQKAIEVALETFLEWQFVPVEKRVNFLLLAAEIMRQRQMDLASWIVYEIGKNWLDADREVSDAIDSLEFYAREALRYATGQSLTKIPTVKNDLKFVPLGVGVILPSWNFPLSDLVNMTAAAIVTGNTVILQPSSESPVIAYKFLEILKEIEMPDGIVNFLPGSGAEVGEFLVKHPQIRFIGFTGSTKVGSRLIEIASKRTKEQKWIKQVIAGMSGINAIIIDKTADLKDAAKGVVESAFGFQGQKCTSCSRVIIDKAIYNKAISLILKETKNIQIGNPIDMENTFGSVIHETAMERILNFIETAKKEGELIHGGKRYGRKRFIIQPTIFKNVSADAKIVQEEVLGPVLMITKSKNFDDAIDIANNTMYGLTGAVYTKSTRNMRYAKDRFQIGNLYFNQKCASSPVDVHPFGGFNMSGTNAKSGGKDYLLQFQQAKLISSQR
ncbi:aldehyde dehydrogenase family protein [bacterium]|nr:aldehyde dehydrogenase family protein [bacterium]